MQIDNLFVQNFLLVFDCVSNYITSDYKDVIAIKIHRCGPESMRVLCSYYSHIGNYFTL